MDPMTYHEAFQLLRRAGTTPAEIDRLYHLRRTYRRSELDQPPLDTKRLHFVRWLVTTGRLTDQIPEPRGNSICLPPHQGASVRLPPRPLPFLFFLVREGGNQSNAGR